MNTDNELENKKMTKIMKIINQTEEETPIETSQDNLENSSDEDKNKIYNKKLNYNLSK